MSFSLGEKDKSEQTSNPDKQKNTLESITDPKRHDELEKGGMMMGPRHPGFRSESHEIQNREQTGVNTQQLRLPEGSVPPGARYEPIIPGIPGDEFNQIGSGSGQQPIAGPDNDELLPPGQQVLQQSEPPFLPPSESVRQSAIQDQTKRIGGNFSGSKGFPF